LRILVDRAGGIDLDALTDASRVISPLLDEHPELAPDGRYQLEVSSPGVERNLRTVEQYRKFIGTEVSVKTSVPVDGARRHLGRLVAADDAGIRLQPKDAADGDVLDLRHDQIERARTVLVWGPTPAPTAGRHQAKHTAAATAAPRPKDARS
jgi:ribosome maturation factor RimP